MKIAVLSDSHMKKKRSQNVIDHLVQCGAEFFIHAGDIGTKETLDQLKNTKLKYVAVYGNNDASLVQYHSDYNLVQEPYTFKVATTTMKLMHMPFYMNADAEVIISGHTHIFHAEQKSGVLFLNPGEVCAREKPLVECAMLEITKESFEVTHYFKDPKAKKFDQRKFNFKRAS
ncbi:MAG: YfcE family phosphodiesterase [Helicobacteraceae bacterium]|nr:YfcE family phosphodiesterase [Helicobacteraceae bacterium]